MHKKPKTDKIPNEKTKMRISEVTDYIFEMYNCIVGNTTIYWWIKKGIKEKKTQLRAIKIGSTWFIDRKDLETFLSMKGLNKRTKS